MRPLHLFVAVTPRLDLQRVCQTTRVRVAALAGGIIFITIIRGDFGSERVKKTVIDTALLIAISVAILVIAALIEVYISPYV